jgi:hypothetical protein
MGYFVWDGDGIGWVDCGLSKNKYEAVFTKMS